MNHSALTITSLTLRRSPAFTLNIDSLELFAGQTACLVGANGSGKSSLMEVVAGIIQVPSGTLKICGKTNDSDSFSTNLRTGYIPDDDGWIIPELTAGEYFSLLESIYRKAGSPYRTDEISNLAQRLSFGAFDQQMSSLSHGNRKKVQIIAGIAHRPELLIVDEVRNGLDPLSIRAAESLLKDLSDKGTAILAATHDLWWAERFASDIFMLRNGSLALHDSVENIKKESGGLEARLFELYEQPDHE